MMKNKGVIAVNKPSDWTSFDVVNKIKYQLKPLKIGHLGTLDPMATGVLLVTVGKATKLFDIMQEKVKTYLAEFEFGYSTDTLDKTGTTMETTNQIPTAEQIKQIIPQFIGKISQVPPKYSAKSINGERAYALARKNVEFEIKPKEVEIYEINFVSYDNNILKVEIKCGSGTYIRSIGRDIASKLNSLATMISLVRTKVGEVSINDCIQVNKETTKETIVDNIIPIRNVLNLPTIDLNESDKFKLLNGQTLQIEKTNGEYLLIDTEDAIAIVKIRENVAKMSIFLG